MSSQDIATSPPTLESGEDADAKIRTCLDVAKPVSFFLFAGAGSGKTRSLVSALNWLRDQRSKRLRLLNQRIGVITFTNAASDEIKGRLDFDPLIEVSTIHSFVWGLIGGFDADIRDWLEVNLRKDIHELEIEQQKGRPTSKAALDRAKKIEAKTRRLANLSSIRRFIYNPAGENRGRDSLNHSEVIQIAATFLTQKPRMQQLLVCRFPVLFVDESQDTNRNLMEALLHTQGQQKDRFCLGLFGDTMQRIYADGKHDLGRNLPEDWATPEKRINHRSPQRVIRLINKVRSEVDTHSQVPKPGAAEGFVRLFIAPNSCANKPELEQRVAKRMAELTGDAKWTPPLLNVKSLTLEHKMAASRMGFLPMFESLYANEDLRIGLLDGTLSGLRLFSDLVCPLIAARQSGNELAVTALVRQTSPLLSNAELKAAGKDQLSKIRAARDAVSALAGLWKCGNSPRFIEVLRMVARHRLFEIPTALQPIASRTDAEQKQVEDLLASNSELGSESDSEVNAWDRCLLTPFAQISEYAKYVSALANFDTHQGVKGLEFNRVLVILDDESAGGFLFSYEKLLGAKEKSKTDIENERSGKESTIDRTRRLFYVVCSRAESSLAVVAYTSSPGKVRDFVTEAGWFEGTEIEEVS